MKPIKNLIVPSHLGALGLAALAGAWIAACGTGGSASDAADASSNRGLAAYLLANAPGSEGAENYGVPFASLTNEGVLAPLVPDRSAFKLPLVAIRASKVENHSNVDLPTGKCPKDNPLAFRDVEAFSLEPSGGGLMLAIVACEGTTNRGGMWFARRDGKFEALEDPGAALPEKYKPDGLVCISGGTCFFLLNRGVEPATLEGNTSTTLVRFSGGRFDKVIVDETENDDTRSLINLSVTASEGAIYAFGIEAKPVGSAVVESVRGLRVQGEVSGPIPALSAYTFVTPPTVAGDAITLGGRRADGGWDALRIQGTAVSVLAKDVAPTTEIVRRVASVGANLVVLRERPRDRGGYDVLLTSDGRELSFPTPSLGVAPASWIHMGDELLMFGAQLAKSPTVNRVAPLFVRITRIDAPPSAQPLADAQGETCSVPKDCIDLEWGLKCVGGHFGCEAGRCQRTCDTTTCGDGTCSPEGGESKKSCTQDCK